MDGVSAHCGLRGDSLGHQQIVGRRDFDVRRLAVDETDRQTRKLDERRFIGRHDTLTPANFERAPQDVALKGLRRLRQVNALARQRLGDETRIMRFPPGELDRIARLDRGHGGA